MSLLSKIGIGIGAIILGYVIVRIISGLLTSLAVWSSPEDHKQDNDSTDTTAEAGNENIPGLHVLTGLPSEHRIIDKNPTEETIRTTIRNLDWAGDFHQVLLVTSPGVCFAVGGSLDPDHGLSSSFHDADKGVDLVITEAPRTVEKMEELMVSFFSGDGQWKRMNTYD